MTPPNLDRHGGLRHWLGFIGSGLLSFAVDSGGMGLLTSFAGWQPQTARLVSIPAAMVVGWLAHRTFTFAVKTPPSFGEFARFVSAASAASLLNYAVFWGLLAVWPAIGSMVALVLATGVATVASYLGFRFGAFHRS